MGIGVHGVVGADYNMSDNFMIFGQIRADQLSLKPSEGKLTKYTVNGVNQLSAMDVVDKETTYKDDTGGYVYDANKPNVVQAKPLAAGSVAINFGIGYKF
ncbi:MAG: hypothetical protein HY796_05155 [Elusimicrobia bacterium]|nr:hypothetical protein [Elusimicrobiota bacterium]